MAALRGSRSLFSAARSFTAPSFSRHPAPTALQFASHRSLAAEVGAHQSLPLLLTRHLSSTARPGCELSQGTDYPMIIGGSMFHEWCKAVAADTLRMAISEAEAKMKSKAGVIGKSDGSELGMKLDSGYVSPHFITDSKSQKCELENPLILIYEKKLYDTTAVEKIIELASKKRRPLLIVAEDIGSDALGSLILSKLSFGVKVCAVKAPGLGDNRKASFHNLANITGGEVITQELGIDIDTVEQNMLGTCKKVTVSRSDTIIIEGAGAEKPTQEKSAEEKDIELLKMHSSESDFLLKHLLEEEKKLEKRQRGKLQIIFKKFIREYQPKRRRVTRRN